MSKTTTSILLIATAALMISGCSSVSKLPTASQVFAKPTWLSKSSEPEKSEVQYQVPQKMLLIWKDSVMSDPPTQPMRGFGGRVFFYDANGDPIRVDGDLVIYGFDDSVKGREGSEADQKFIFPASEIQQHYSKSGLGDSYSFWVPWDKAGGPEKSVTLIPFFKTKDGTIVRGGQSIYTLKGPGTKLYKEELADDKSSAKESTSPPVSTAGYVESDVATNTGMMDKGVEQVSYDDKKENPRVRTTTIDVPRSLGQRISQNIANSQKLPSTASAGMATKRAPASVNQNVANPTNSDSKEKVRAVRERTRYSFGKPGEL